MTTAKKKDTKKRLIILIVSGVLIAGLVVFLIIRAQQQKSSSSSTSSSTTITEVQVTTMDLTNTLSTSGAVTAAADENLSLRTKYYLGSILVDKGAYVTAGTKLIKYTNGKYFTAPYDGVVTGWNLPDQDEVITNAHYITMEATDTLQVSLSVSESDIGSVALGQQVEIAVSAVNGKFTGYITYISEIGTYSSSGSTFAATATFVNDGTVKIGMSASCTVILESADNAICVPVEAIQTQGDEKYVVVVASDGTTSKVTVTTGISNDAYIQVLTGLTGTETVQMTQTTSSSSNNRGNGGMPSGGDMPSGGGSMPSGGGSMPSGGPSSGGGSSN